MKYKYHVYKTKIFHSHCLEFSGKLKFTIKLNGILYSFGIICPDLCVSKHVDSSRL